MIGGEREYLQCNVMLTVCTRKASVNDDRVYLYCLSDARYTFSKHVSYTHSHDEHAMRFATFWCMSVPQDADVVKGGTRMEFTDNNKYSLQYLFEN